MKANAMKLLSISLITLIAISCTPEKPKSQSSNPQPAVHPNGGQTSTWPTATPSSSFWPNSSEKPSSTPFPSFSPQPSSGGNNSPLPSKTPQPSLQPPQGGKCKTGEIALSIFKNGKTETLCWDGRSHISDDNMIVKDK